MSSGRDFATQIADAVLKGPGNVVTVPAAGTFLVADGVVREVAPLPTALVVLPDGKTFLVREGAVTRVHQVRKEGEFLLNRCEPGDPCGAEDGCNV